MGGLFLHDVLIITVKDSVLCFIYGVDVAMKLGPLMHISIPAAGILMLFWDGFILTNYGLGAMVIIMVLGNVGLTYGVFVFIGKKS